MTVLYIKKKLSCGEKCHENFTKTIVNLCPSFDSGINGHITLTHGSPYHQCWITFYQKNFHENWTLNGIVKTKFNDTQKNYKGKIPTKTELENL